MEVVLQRIVFSEDTCNETELFFRTTDIENIQPNKENIKLGANTSVQTDTYMNMFDASFWKRYTSVSEWKLCVEVQGQGNISLCEYTPGGIRVVSEAEVSSACFIKRSLALSRQRGMFFLSVQAKTELTIKRACYCTEKREVNPTHLSLVICTYHRKKQVLKTIDKLKNSLFFQEESELYHGLSIRVVDNGSNLKAEKNEYIKIYSNRNNGGSGGFAKGIIESRKDKDKFGINRIIFMDDDVEIIPETLYRLFAVMQLIRPEYGNYVLSGRMFRMDDRAVQYTAAEIWNKGNIQHIGHNSNMRNIQNLADMNGERGEYAGWWFACYPMWFADKNLPLPFFLHCDDVEYGLRYGRKVLVLNGIQVWHETYEYRTTPLITYYDMRNSMIVRTLYEKDINCSQLYDEWKQRLDESCLQKDYEKAYALIVAWKDYLKGKKAFLRSGNKIKRLSQVKLFMRFRTAVMWRTVQRKYEKKGNKAFTSYKNMEKS